MNLEWFGDFLDFIKSWRGAFCTFAGGLTALVLRLYGIVPSDFLTVVTIIPAFGFWMLVALISEAAWNAWSASRKQKSDFKAAAAGAEDRQKKAIANLRTLEDSEQEALFWIWRQPNHRARASINNIGIEGLVDSGLLVAEDKTRSIRDCIWVIPQYVADELSVRLKDVKFEKLPSKPPWEGKSWY